MLTITLGLIPTVGSLALAKGAQIAIAQTLHFRDVPHIGLMAREHPHTGATYRVIVQENLTYGVEVVVPGTFPALVTSFATEEIAEAWITNHKRRVAENVPRRFMRTRGPRS